MASVPIAPDAAEKELEAVLASYLRAVEEGRAPDRMELLARHREMAPDLAAFFAGQDRFGRLAAPLRQAVSDIQELTIEQKLAEGGRLGDFRLIHEIGRGGMGIVYEATQISLGRRVALKVLPFAAAVDAKQLQRFKNEAHAAAHLQHTNIVPVYFVGCERGVHFYAMQFVEGQTLAQLIAELRGLRIEDRGSKVEEEERRTDSKSVQRNEATGPYSPPKESPEATTINDQAAANETAPVTLRSSTLDSRSSSFFRAVANLGIQAAEALEHAHQLGVIHRDIKPANLMIESSPVAPRASPLTPDPSPLRLWITDFGLAHCQGGCELTMSGDLLGTLRYMSPEQALAKRVIVDERTDIYSLGVTLYELLTLEPAFPGSDRQEILRRIAFEEPKPPRRLNKAIPAELETIVLKAMAKSPEDRYSRAQEVADDLRRFLEDKPIHAKRPNLWQRMRKWSRRHKTLVTGALVVVLIVLVAAASSSLVMWRAYVAERKAGQAEAVRRQRTQGSLKFAFNVLSGTYQSMIHIQPSADPETKKEQQALIRRALDFYKQFAEENGDDPSVRIEVALGYGRMAYMYKTLGDYKRAREVFDRAFALIEQAAAENQTDSDSQAMLGAAYNSLANFLADEGDFTKAIALDERAVVILSRLAPDSLMADPQARFWQAMTYKVLAQHLNDQGIRWTNAGEYYQRAIDVVNRLLEDFPHDATYMQLQGVSYMELGNARKGASDREGAKESYLQAIQIHTRLTEEFPDGFSRSDLLPPSYIPAVQFQSDLALSHHNLANMLRERNEEWPAAEAHYRQAVHLWTQADKLHPNMAEFNWWLGMAHENLGSLLREKGDREEARLHLDQAIGFLTPVIHTSPKVGRFRNQLVSCYFHLGEVMEDDHRIAEAEKAYRDAFKTAQALARDCPQVQQLGYPVSSAFALAHILIQTGRRQEAKDFFRQAIDLAVAADQLEMLNQAAWQLSICPDSELRDPTRAVEFGRKAVQKTPKNGDYWNTLGAAEYRAGNWKAALEAFERSTKLKEGSDSSDWFFMAMAHWQLGDNEQAREWFRKAVTWMDKYGPEDKELRLFRPEAATLLGIKDQEPNRKGKNADGPKR